MNSPLQTLAALLVLALAAGPFITWCLVHRVAGFEL